MSKRPFFTKIISQNRVHGPHQADPGSGVADESVVDGVVSVGGGSTEGESTESVGGGSTEVESTESGGGSNATKCGHGNRLLRMRLRSWTSAVTSTARSRFTRSSTEPAMTSAMMGPSMLLGKAETLTAARATKATIWL